MIREMSKKNVGAEFSMQETPEHIQYPEFNDLNRKNEFNDKFYNIGHSSSGESSSADKQIATYKKSLLTGHSMGILQTVAAAVATTTIVAAAVLLSILVTVTHVSIGADYLMVEMDVQNAGDVPLMAVLLDENGEQVADRPLEPDSSGYNVFFRDLHEGTTYTLRILREDNGDVLFEEKYKTEGEFLPSYATLTLEHEDVSADWLLLIFTSDGRLPEKMRATVNGEPARLEIHDGSVAIEAHDLPAGARVEVEIIDESDGRIMYSGEFTTAEAPSASVELEEAVLDYYGVKLTFTTDNPFGHPITAAVDGSPAQADVDEYGTLTVHFDGIPEGTRFEIVLTDTYTGEHIWRETFETPTTPDAYVGIIRTEIGFSSITLEFSVDNPFAHELTVSLDGGAPLRFSDAMTFDGLAEGSTHTVSVTDTHTGETVWNEVFTTRSAGSVGCTLTDSQIGYFAAEFTFRTDNPAGHALNVTIDDSDVAFEESGDTLRVRVRDLAEQSAHTLRVIDTSTGSAVYVGSFTTPATPPATVAIGSTSADFFSVTLVFSVDNAFNHELTVSFDGGAPLPLRAEMTFDGLSEGTVHTVTVTDTHTGTAVLSETVRTRAAGDSSVSLQATEIGYFDAALTFAIDNPAGHTLRAYLGDSELPLSVTGSTGTVSIRELSEKTSYTVKIVDDFTGATVYTGTITTKATPAATVTLNGTPSVGYFNINLNFNISNPYNHNLVIALDGGAEQTLTASVSFTGLAEGSAHTVTVTDKNTGTAVFTRSVSTSSAGSATAALSSSTVNYFDATLTFTLTNPASHTLKAYLGSTAKTFTVSGSTGTLSLTGLAEKTSYTVKIVDDFTGATVYTGTITTKATPAATVTLNGTPSVGYFNINLSFNISNPYNHNLVIALDGGAEQTLTASVSFTGLAEGSAHTVTVTDKNTGTAVFTRSVSTSSAGSATAALSSSTVNYFDATLTFTLTNPASHTLKAYLGSTAKTFTVSGSSGTLSLTGLAEKTSYTVKIVDDFTGTTVYTGTITTKATPAATVTLNGTPSVGYFNINLNFNISNPYNHNLVIALDGGAEQTLTASVSFTGLAEGSAHTVTVTDKNTGTAVFTRSVSTSSAGSASAALSSSTVNYFDATLTFTLTNPASHTLKAYLGSTAKTFTVSGSTGTLRLTGLAEKTSYTVKIVDDFTGATVYTGSITTQETPAATVKLSKSTVTCFDITLTFAAPTNTYAHTLTLVVDGREQTFSTTVSLSGLDPLTKHTVAVRDTNPTTKTVKTVYSKSFTTNAPAVITQDTDGTLHYRIDDSFRAAYPDGFFFLAMEMDEESAPNPDYAHVWLDGTDNEGLSGSSQAGAFVFKGTYEVSVYFNQMEVATFPYTAQYGLSQCELKMTYRNSAVSVSVVSGELPVPGANDRIVVHFYDKDWNWISYTSGEDFTYSTGGFTIPITGMDTREYIPVEFQLELIRHNTEYDYDDMIHLCGGTVS